MTDERTTKVEVKILTGYMMIGGDRGGHGPKTGRKAAEKEEDSEEIRDDELKKRRGSFIARPVVYKWHLTHTQSFLNVQLPLIKDIKLFLRLSAISL
jgi:hypothetical protein